MRGCVIRQLIRECRQLVFGKFTKEGLFCILMQVGQSSGDCLERERSPSRVWLRHVSEYFVQTGEWGQTVQLTVYEARRECRGSGLAVGEQGTYPPVSSKSFEDGWFFAVNLFPKHEVVRSLCFPGAQDSGRAQHHHIPAPALPPSPYTSFQAVSS